MKIKLSTIDDVKKFSSIACSMNADIDVSYGHYVIDGKSIMGLFSLDLSHELNVSIYASDDNDLIQYQNMLSEFIVK